jgi:DNA-binding LytR/AlgR family response regulator
MNKDQNLVIRLLKEELALYFKISFGIFLFVLFFQPFILNKFDFDNLLVFVSGLGGIVLIIMLLVRISTVLLIREYDKKRSEAVIPVYLEGFAILALSSVSFAFYLKFVGSISITFHVMFKVCLICLAPPVVLYLYESIRDLKKQNQILVREKKDYRKKAKKYEEDYLNKTLEISSESGTEKITFLIADVVFIKSADNYVEIAYYEDNQIKKSLIRNTLKNIEQQLKPYSNFIRCHRICIVNEHFIGDLHQDGTHWLNIKGTNEKLPVSRQYLIKLKEIAW